MAKQIGPGSKYFGPVCTKGEGKDWLWVLGWVLLCVLLAIFSPWSILNSKDEAGAQTPPQTPNCELTILDPDGNQRATLNSIPVPGDATIPNSPLQPDEAVTAVLGDQCPEIGMTLYVHPDNTQLVAHPDSVIVAEDEAWELPNGAHGIRLVVPSDFDPCAYQLDLYRGGQIDSFAGGARYGPRLIDALNWYSADDNCLTVPTTTTTVPQQVTTTVPITTTTVPTTTSTPETENSIDTTNTTGSTRVTSLPDTGSSTSNLFVAGLLMALIGLALIRLVRRTH